MFGSISQRSWAPGRKAGKENARCLGNVPLLQPLFQLSLADLVLAACWLIGAILYSQRCNHLSTLCYNLHTVEQVTHLQHNHLWTPTITHRFGDCCFGVLGESF
ncbi:hypothetical protein GOODEAATRI_017106 [Goodea atripinnis]|uniref:Uncharacterized protein n=1 Tax=Goodea atripinnis TaxID=208336 RepID=A0ABV0NVF9_9TELE